MTYFSNLPKIYYDFNINGANEIRVIRDISTSVRIKKELLETITLYDEYDIKDGETPDIISERIYGSPYYHWIIMLLNERFDYINDFPLSISQLQQHVTDAYGIGNAKKIHHYVNSNGYILSATEAYYDQYTNNKKIICKLTNGNKTVISQTVGAFTEIRNDTSREYQVFGTGISSNDIVKITNFVDNSTFVMNISANLSGPPIETELTFIAMINPMNSAIAVTNFEYESEINESKRRIKLLHPSMLQSVMEQLKVLING